MDEISKHDFQPETPCIKVVGVGETVAPVIESLKDNWKGDIDAGMAENTSFSESIYCHQADICHE